MKKRFLSALLVLCMMLTLFPSFTFAADDLDTLKSTYLSKDQYYYNQLSPEHKAAWEFDIKNVLNFPTRNAASTSNAKYQALARMIQADNPRIFWVDWIDKHGELRYDTSKVSTDPAYYEPHWSNGEVLSQLQKNFLAAIPKDVAEIQASLPESPTLYDKVKAIHDWLCDNSTYNGEQTSDQKEFQDPVSFEYLAAHSAYSAIIKGDVYEPVCEGYSAAFKIFCEEFGIECICVSGKAFGGGHMWNYVKMEDEKWYLVDVTNDDPDSNQPISYNFFLSGTKQNATTHAPEAQLGAGTDDPSAIAEFTFPSLAPVYWYVIPLKIAVADEYGGKKVTLSGRNGSIKSKSLYMYYTEDGSDPTESSQSEYHFQEQEYIHNISKELWVSTDKTIKAMLSVGSSTWSQKSFSAITSQEIQVNQTSTPKITISGATVKIDPPESASSDVRIYYTVNGNEPKYIGGSTPSITGNLYTKEFTIREGDIVQAIAVDKGCTASTTVSATAGHIHNFGTEWKSDESNHWHQCNGCDEKNDVAAHTFESATNGSNLKKCKDCGYSVTGKTIIASGTCGDNVTWTLDAEGTLTVSGTGPMADYMNGRSVPWDAYKESIEHVVIESGVTKVGSGAFLGCTAIRSLTLAEGLEQISDFAFESCDNLTDVHIPASVKSIGDGAFASCNKLNAIVVASANMDYCSVDGIVYNKNKTKVLACPAGFNGSCKILDGVTEIGNRAFCGCKLLTTVSIPNTVTRISGMAFSECTNLSAITLPNKLATIGARAFSNSGLRSCTNRLKPIE